MPIFINYKEPKLLNETESWYAQIFVEVARPFQLSTCHDGDTELKTLQILRDILRLPEIKEVYLGYIDQVKELESFVIEVIGDQPIDFDNETTFVWATNRFKDAIQHPASAKLTLDLRTKFDRSDRNVVGSSSVVRLTAEGDVVLLENSAASVFNKSATLDGLLRLNELDLANLTAAQISFLQAILENAARHRARSDLFDVELGDKVTVQQVNQFLKKNAGKILETHQKEQLAKVIQELMKSEGVELWRDENDWKYRYTITVTGRSNTKTKRFDLKPTSPDGKLIRSSAVPSGIRLEFPENSM